MKKAPQTGLGLIYLHTPWCSYCKTTGPAIDDIDKERDDITVVKIDGEDDLDTAMEVGVKTFPTIVLTRDGKELARRGSGLTEDLREWINENS